MCDLIELDKSDTDVSTKSSWSIVLDEKPSGNESNLSIESYQNISNDDCNDDYNNGDGDNTNDDAKTKNIKQSKSAGAVLVKCSKNKLDIIKDVAYRLSEDSIELIDKNEDGCFTAVSILGDSNDKEKEKKLSKKEKMSKPRRKRNAKISWQSLFTMKGFLSTLCSISLVFAFLMITTHLNGKASLSVGVAKNNEIPGLVKAIPQIVEENPLLDQINPSMGQGNSQLLQASSQLVQDTLQLGQGKARLEQDKPQVEQGKPQFVQNKQKLVQDEQELVKEDLKLMQENPHLLQENFFRNDQFSSSTNKTEAKREICSKDELLAKNPPSKQQQKEALKATEEKQKEALKPQEEEPKGLQEVQKNIQILDANAITAKEFFQKLFEEEELVKSEKMGRDPQKPIVGKYEMDEFNKKVQTLKTNEEEAEILNKKKIERVVYGPKIKLEPTDVLASILPLVPDEIFKHFDAVEAKNEKIIKSHGKETGYVANGENDLPKSIHSLGKLLRDTSPSIKVEPTSKSQNGKEVTKESKVELDQIQASIETSEDVKDSQRNNEPKIDSKTQDQVKNVEKKLSSQKPEAATKKKPSNIKKLKDRLKNKQRKLPTKAPKKVVEKPQEPTASPSKNQLFSKTRFDGIIQFFKRFFFMKHEFDMRIMSIIHDLLLIIWMIQVYRQNRKETLLRKQLRILKKVLQDHAKRRASQNANVKKATALNDERSATKLVAAITKSLLLKMTPTQKLFYVLPFRNANITEVYSDNSNSKLKGKSKTTIAKKSKKPKKQDSADKLCVDCRKDSKIGKTYIEELKKIRKDQRQFLENMKTEKQKLLQEIVQERTELKNTLKDAKKKYETNQQQPKEKTITTSATIKPRIALKRKGSPLECNKVDKIIERAVIQGVNSELMKEHRKQLSKYYKTKQEYLNRRLEISNLLHERILNTKETPSSTSSTTASSSVSNGNLNDTSSNTTTTATTTKALIADTDRRNGTDLLDSMINVAIKKIKRKNNSGASSTAGNNNKKNNNKNYGTNESPSSSSSTRTALSAAAAATTERIITAPVKIALPQSSLPVVRPATAPIATTTTTTTTTTTPTTVARSSEKIKDDYELNAISVIDDDYVDVDGDGDEKLNKRNDVIVSRNQFKFGLSEKCNKTLYEWVFGKKAVEIKKKDDEIWYIRREIFKRNLPESRRDPKTLHDKNSTTKLIKSNL